MVPGCSSHSPSVGAAAARSPPSPIQRHSDSSVAPENLRQLQPIGQIVTAAETVCLLYRQQYRSQSRAAPPLSTKKSWKMWKSTKAPITRLTVCVVATCSYIFGVVHVRVRRRLRCTAHTYAEARPWDGVDWMQKHKSGFWRISSCRDFWLIYNKVRISKPLQQLSGLICLETLIIKNDL